jgi:hypothetical protein
LAALLIQQKLHKENKNTIIIIILALFSQFSESHHQIDGQPQLQAVAMLLRR